ncbi:unnamed protein product [Rotaria sp. Silwood2]|nr:unnamed protein product [Rotaria sp. Silwood2]CAF2917839.1 unnamed protein product [Rotaria sp. Silwood2]CAF4355692.1 unnamed protein product [Rotaria sp. Silwood2]
MNNYVYKCNKKTIKTKYWICTISGCKVFVHTDFNNNYLCGGKNEHEHAANPELLEIHQTRQQIKRRVMNESTPIGAVYDEEMSKTSMSSTAIAIFPTVHEIYEGFAKTRRKAMPAVPQSCIFDIPEQYTLTIDKKRFLLLDEVRVRRERLLVFSSDIQLDLLFNSSIVYMDGTYSSTLRLQQHYLSDENFRLLCRKLMALGLMPLDKGVNSFQDVRSAAQCLPQLQVIQLLQYFENNWMSNIELWNLFGLDSRTNNICEG